MRGKVYIHKDSGVKARLCNGKGGLIIYGDMGTRFICAKKMNYEEYLETNGFVTTKQN